MTQSAKQLSDKVDSLLAEYLGDNKRDLVEIKKSLLSLINEAKDSTEKGFQEIDNYVSENQWKSIGIASALGVIIGLLVAKK